MKKFEYTEISHYNLIIGNDQFKLVLKQAYNHGFCIELLKADCDSNDEIMGWLSCRTSDSFCLCDADRRFIQVLTFCHEKGVHLTEIMLCCYISEI